MTQRGIEIVLGRLATDEATRRRFARAPRQTLRELAALGIELTPEERLALQSLDPSAVLEMADALGPRLQRMALVEQPPGSNGATGGD